MDQRSDRMLRDVDQPVGSLWRHRAINKPPEISRPASDALPELLRYRPRPRGHHETRWGPCGAGIDDLRCVCRCGPGRTVTRVTRGRQLAASQAAYWPVSANQRSNTATRIILAPRSRQATTRGKIGPDYGYLWWLNTEGKTWPDAPTHQLCCAGQRLQHHLDRSRTRYRRGLALVPRQHQRLLQTDPSSREVHESVTARPSPARVASP